MPRVVKAQQIPREVVELCRTLADKGYTGWVVGGCLRDLLLGRQAADWDLATDATPEQVGKAFPKVLPTGIAHGTVTVRHRGQSFEVTTLRGEGAYSDGRRPDSVAFVREIAEDLSRRDFTVNALAYDPLKEELIDPFGGQDDLGRRLIRAVGAAERRFSEDGLRVLRAARFCASLEFELEPSTEAAIPGTLATFRKVSAERVRDEWLKALRAREPARAFAVMQRTGILAVIFPALSELPGERLETSFAAINDPAGLGDPLLRLAALLWPLSPEREAVSAWLLQYRFSNQERERVLRLLRHARCDARSALDGVALRRLAQAIERPHLADVAGLSVLLAEAQHGSESPEAGEARDFHARMTALAKSGTPLSQRELALTGKDLMAELGLAPGPRLGSMLQALMERVIEQPELNQRERLVELARGMV
jgi:tRNA nucleotidyltransferase (CCA-adding enzyme)